jgi:hypothetical protein
MRRGSHKGFKEIAARWRTHPLIFLPTFRKNETIAAMGSLFLGYFAG